MPDETILNEVAQSICGYNYSELQPDKKAIVLGLALQCDISTDIRDISNSLQDIANDLQQVRYKQ